MIEKHHLLSTGFPSKLRNVLDAVQKFSAQIHVLFLTATGQQTIVADSDKAFGKHMHQKHSKKLSSFDCLRDILTSIPVVFYKISNGFIRHTDNSSVTYGYKEAFDWNKSMDRVPQVQ